MTPMTIHLEGDNCWPDLQGADGLPGTKVVDGGNIDAIALLDGGMTSGKPSVCVRVNLPSGRTLLAQTSLALLLTACDAFKAKVGDPRE
jgi:hypothetical protein